METYLVAEVYEQQTYMRIFQNVAEARHHAVAPILGIGDGALVEDFHKPCMATSKGRVGVSFRVRRADEHQLLACEKCLHRGIEMVEHLMLVERHCMSGPSVFLLQAMLAIGAGYRSMIGDHLCDHFDSFFDE